MIWVLLYMSRCSIRAAGLDSHHSHTQPVPPGIKSSTCSSACPRSTSHQRQRTCRPRQARRNPLGLLSPTAHICNQTTLISTCKPAHLPSTDDAASRPDDAPRSGDLRRAVLAGSSHARLAIRDAPAAATTEYAKYLGNVAIQTPHAYPPSRNSQPRPPHPNARHDRPPAFPTPQTPPPPTPKIKEKKEKRLKNPAAPSTSPPTQETRDSPRAS